MSAARQHTQTVVKIATVSSPPMREGFLFFLAVSFVLVSFFFRRDDETTVRVLITSDKLDTRSPVRYTFNNCVSSAQSLSHGFLCTENRDTAECVIRFIIYPSRKIVSQSYDGVIFFFFSFIFGEETTQRINNWRKIRAKKKGGEKVKRN